MRSLTKTLARCYFTPVQKPITSLALNSIVELTGEALSFGACEWAMPVEASVVMGAMGLRCGLEVLGLCFQSLSMKSKDGPMQRWVDKIFLVDMRRDVQFYQLDNDQYRRMSRYYQLSHLFTNFLKSYTILNIMRGAYHMISTGVWQNTPSLLAMHLHDPYFVLPILVIAANYLILSRSRHPFFIHLVRPQNKLMCLNIAFMGGLLFVPAPVIYPLTYLGLSLGHLIIRSMRHGIEDARGQVRGWLRKLTKRNKK